jgi:hypothetical protein
MVPPSSNIKLMKKPNFNASFLFKESKKESNKKSSDGLKTQDIMQYEK